MEIVFTTKKTFPNKDLGVGDGLLEALVNDFHHYCSDVLGVETKSVKWSYCKKDKVYYCKISVDRSDAERALIEAQLTERLLDSFNQWNFELV